MNTLNSSKIKHSLQPTDKHKLIHKNIYFKKNIYELLIIKKGDSSPFKSQNNKIVILQ